MSDTREIVVTISEDGSVRIQIVNNDSPGHGELLKPFESTLSDGDRAAVHSHRHDHHHDHTHQKHGGGHS